ncbi:ABC transporter ATP-binding protein [Thiohalocapsa marina]|uniref:ABC transporter ATP-binding protein n=1 Tax=Thiohalocapsa marina TaxID=424902 RepID=A0A5M8FPD7_9GAMM|nr:ABC transporter ATP-binding protein [Thiohalocapsa marina]KAA6186344.1 ABC transporter ATP-binding protein [Thiohalocapsa marina]
MGNNATADPDIAIRCVDVHKTYCSGDVETPVLRGIDLEIRRGELSVILGASGAGKSTLLNIIGGIDRPTRGEVWCEGRNLAVLDDRHLTEYRRRSVGFVFQFYNLVPTLTALENVETATQIADDPMDPAEALRLVGLDDRRDHFPAQLSGGQQQRVSIARALAKNPLVVFCDEPTGALDANTGRHVLDLLTRLNEQTGATIVIVTHAAPVAQLAHAVLHLTMNGITATRNTRRACAAEISW